MFGEGLKVIEMSTKRRCGGSPVDGQTHRFIGFFSEINSLTQHILLRRCHTGILY